MAGPGEGDIEYAEAAKRDEITRNEDQENYHMYDYQILSLYRLLKENNMELTNYNLSKIFEYYSCIVLSKKDGILEF